MSRSRNRLAVKNLADFKAYCESFNWKACEPKSCYEALRMIHPEHSGPLLVHQKASTRAGGEPVHYTTSGISDQLLTKFILHNKSQRSVSKGVGNE